MENTGNKQVTENEEAAFTMDELIEYIQAKTSIEKEVIEKVFTAENEFMIEKGFLEE